MFTNTTKITQVSFQDAKQKGWFIIGTELNREDQSKTVLSTKDLIGYLTSLGNGTHAVGSVYPWQEKPTILILGNEGKGLSANISDACDLHVIIPQGHKDFKHSDAVNSLNVSVAGGIIMNLMREIQLATSIIPKPYDGSSSSSIDKDSNDDKDSNYALQFIQFFIFDSTKFPSISAINTSYKGCHGSSIIL